MLAGNFAQPLELRQRTRAGTTVFVEVWAQNVEYGGRAAWLVFAFDVSEQKALESALITAISGEQRRLGQDLHDGLAQDLTVASILTSELAAQFEERGLPMFPELSRLSDRIGSALTNARNIAHGLSPLMSSNGDLAAALAQLARSSAVGDTRIEASTRIESELRLPLEARTHLYRIAQEAIQNALKHADAHRIEVRLTVRPTAVKLEVEDDGLGIDQDRAKGSGFGTNAMRDRSSAIGGLLSIRAGKAGGTVISCIAPQSPPGDASHSEQRLGVGRMLG
jgi:two-component system sensor kinase FixL